jgi:2-polyprenyl-3-methyl-5-hydroxy-6-metoxy-1,4-benzoquinol methylase
LSLKIEVKCPVCASNQFHIKYEPWIEIDDPAKLYGAASGIQGTQRLVQCEKCNMIYENPRYTDDDILAGYMSSDEGGHDSQYPMRVESFYRALRSLTGRIPETGGSILDIGTAGGAFLEAANKYGYNAVGLEPSKYLVEQGKKRGLNILQGTIDTNTLEPCSFDMVCLWDVIEHLTDPRQALEKIRSLLKPDGTLLINFPDIGTWQAKLAGKRFWWILSVHLHHFTRDTITKICECTGFEVFHFQRYWQILQLGYLEDMAIHYKIPLSVILKRVSPDFIQRIPLPYYASQTTAIARVKP